VVRRDGKCMMERKIWRKGDRGEKDQARDEVLKENRTTLNYDIM